MCCMFSLFVVIVVRSRMSAVLYDVGNFATFVHLHVQIDFHAWSNRLHQN